MERFELQTCTDGSVTLKDLDLGEAMHSHLGPYVEAMALYIGQSRLKERLSHGSEPLVIYDLGLGIAANALAAIDHAHGARPLLIHSFESKIDGLKLALESPSGFPWLKPHEEKARTLISRGEWTAHDESIRWRLHAGDFREVALPADRPDLIFFDFYSPKTSPELWSCGMFKRLRDHSPNASLYTYSAATSVRSALILAGWHVGYGVGTAAKRETTIACTSRNALERPLDEKWRNRFLHSTHALPSDRDSDDARSDVLRLLGVSGQTHSKQ